jgi:hypothetical protein
MLTVNQRMDGRPEAQPGQGSMNGIACRVVPRAPWSYPGSSSLRIRAAGWVALVVSGHVTEGDQKDIVAMAGSSACRNDNRTCFVRD